MKYACLVYIDPAIMGALSPAQGAKLTNDTIEEDWELRRSGHLILGQPLQPPEMAVTIRMRDGKMSTTNGPFAETREFLGGFFLIEARDLNEAVRLAGESRMAEMGSIEVRPFLDQTHSETGQARPPLA